MRSNSSVPSLCSTPVQSLPARPRSVTTPTPQVAAARESKPAELVRNAAGRLRQILLSAAIDSEADADNGDDSLTVAKEEAELGGLRRRGGRLAFGDEPPLFSFSSDMYRQQQQQRRQRRRGRRCSRPRGERALFNTQSAPEHTTVVTMAAAPASPASPSSILGRLRDLKTKVG